MANWQRLELRFPPLALTLAFAALMVAADRMAPALALTGRHGHVAGTAILLIGGLVCLVGVIQFRAHATTVDPMAPDRSSALVTTGIYHHTRNPMYLGFAVMLIGVGTILGSLPALALLPLFVIYLTRFQIVPEERILAGKFGAPYFAYLARVPRWL
ncbi:MAG: isoprenylcysteine carboxylmethyltransferase family protein [Sulfuritalea sp.]|jgi:protein-S-isoprenylcysteine O-methyltransferase Ste14|nr:isoprenylcysteine carboxylmethyltransferase family protein [Sulfuritalea sp.]